MESDNLVGVDDPRAMVPTSSGKTRIGKAESIAYRTVGDGAREIVFVHGWMMTGAVFGAVVDALDTAELRLFLPNLRGGGGSSRDVGDYTLHRYADDICQVIDNLGIDNPIIVGHGMGGQLAQLVAATLGTGVSGVALINPVPLGGLALPSELEPLFRAAAEDRSMRRSIFEQCAVRLSPHDGQRLLGITDAVASACIAESLSSWTKGDDTSKLQSITAPTLVISSDDVLLPVPLLQEAVVAPLANATLEHIDGAGHYSIVEAPGAVARALQAFFAAAG